MSADPFAGLDVVGAPTEVVALGATLDPATLRAAYRAGCFPWPPSDPSSGSWQRAARRLARWQAVPVLPGRDAWLPWCSPDPRAVLVPGMLSVPRSLRRRLRTCGWRTTVDTAFPEVVAGCADRSETWITGRMQQAYAELHATGGASSLEVWDGDRLVGGLYGVRTGAVFSGESMFSRTSDASKVALVDLVDRLREGGFALLDTQQASEHLARLGQAVVSRREYVRAVHLLRDLPAELPLGERLVDRLAG